MEQYCTFEVGPLSFGVEVERVQEVLRFQKMTRVPLSCDAVRGLINLRGEIVTAVDLRKRLMLPEREGELPMNVVIRSDEGAISLLVDDIGDVLELDESAFEPPPITLAGPTARLARRICKLEGTLLLILDTDAAVQIDHPNHESRSAA
ncbi:MAG: chemotaxis protein CheW [Sandaracinaceae bacterium]